MKSFDVIYAGGGMVGLALACGLHGCGLRIAIIENHPVTTHFHPQDDFALRYLRLILPVSYYSRNWGVWENLTALRTASYQGMEVWDQDSFGRIAFQRNKKGYLIWHYY